MGDRVLRTTTQGRLTTKNKNELQKRVGAWVRRRRDDLGLSQGDLRRRLGYRSQGSVSNIEQGRTTLPTSRAYAWADVLDVPRDAFFEFVTGLRTSLELRQRRSDDGAKLSPVETELVASYRALPPRLQNRLREYATELTTLARLKSDS